MARKQTTVRRRYNAEAGGDRLCPCDGSVFTEMGVASAYMATDRAGATPRRLRVMLYDGAIRLCRQGLLALDGGEVTLAADRLARAGRIVEKLRRDLLAEGRTERLGQQDPVGDTPLRPQAGQVRGLRHPRHESPPRAEGAAQEHRSHLGLRGDPQAPAR